MRVLKNAVLLRIFIGGDRRYRRRPLYESIVLKARESHLAGATVLHGPMGFGHSSRLRTVSILHLSEDLPIVIEIVDNETKIKEFLPVLEEMIDSGLATIEKVHAIAYGDLQQAPGTASPPSRWMPLINWLSVRRKRMPTTDRRGDRAEDFHQAAESFASNGDCRLL